jgi:hypothetical protein
MRADAATIPAPAFPRELPWVNAAMLRMDQQAGKVVLVEFWDFCRVNSLRTLPYVRAWHEKYAEAGLRMISIHTGAFPPSRDDEEVRSAVARLAIDWPVAIDTQLQMWDLYGNEGWPARYLWDRDLHLHSLHYGEGAYVETERELQELLGVAGPLVEPVRPEDVPDALLVAQTPDQPGAYAGPYEAGEVWAVVSGPGVVTVDGRDVTAASPGCVQLLAHAKSTAGDVVITPGEGVEVYATCFTPGLAS